ncbi:MAG: enoyl-CoA hydratase/isomerase family protein, partial [Verrucomicrobiales bacterium]|nr:enoyl-CoA hydratase/isomerase family protein [Verrucomicrobiales bacterium]
FLYRIDNDGLCWMTFDSPNSTVNVWSTESLTELASHLEHLSHETALRGFIFRSAKERIFIAGADLKSMRNLPSSGLQKLVWLGQATFDRLARLPVPKVALIRGACAGGGYELTLACDYRIAIEDDCTRIGLPETQLGLLPGWGGCTRLPRLIGTRRALDVILKGRLMDARNALRQGLVTHLVPAGHAEDTARKLLKQPVPSAPHHWDRSPLVTPFLRWAARRKVEGATRSLYEAPLRAIDVVTAAASHSVEFGLQLERDALNHLLMGSQAQHLIDLFFQREAASKHRPAIGVAMPVHNAAVVGAGVMGAGIAQALAARGLSVLMTDVAPEALAHGIERVRDLTDTAVRKHAIDRKTARDTLDRVSTSCTPVPLTHKQIVIEAATENMALKKKIFADLAARSAADTILATNTSALSVAELAATVPHPERVIGMHFFNPVHRMPLVEIVRLPETSPDVLATAIAFVQKLGKVPVVVQDSPGFVVNRILMPYLLEAVRLVEEGVPVERTDNAMLDFGMPMGPLRLLDEIGIDVANHVYHTLREAFSDRLPALKTLDTLLAAGHLGKKSGQGFYLHTKAETKAKVFSATANPLDADSIQLRLSLVLSNEAALCLHEGIASSAGDIDLAMVLGTGYAPFRGGPLQHLDSIGRDYARSELHRLAHSMPAPNPFTPAP